ncbi:MAG: hypothetical protein WBG46_12575 [Nonlabens sp.]
MGRKIFSILNLLSIIVLIAWNGYANTGNFNGKTVGDLSAEYNNLFTPASYAFSIWGVIFISLLVFGVYGVYSAFAKASTALPEGGIPNYRKDFVLTTSPWFLIANIFCTVWVAFWLEEMIGLSVFCMFGILLSLFMCINKLDMEIWDAPFPIIAFVWWPLCLYSGWISVASIANVSAWLNGSFQIDFDIQLYSTIAMIVVAFCVNLLMIIYRNMREFALVGVWALVAIFVRHLNEYNSIAYTALVLGVLLFVAAGIHGSHNKDTHPAKKFKQWRAAQ